MGQTQQRSLHDAPLLGAERLRFRPGRSVRGVGRLIAAGQRRIERQRGTAGAASQLIGAAVGGDAHEPGAKTLAAERTYLAVGGQKCVLGRIFRSGRAADHTKTEVEDSALVQLDQPVERIEFAGEGAAEVLRFSLVWRRCRVPRMCHH